MFGVEINGPCNIFCDNQGMVKNSSIPESALMKKHNAVNYHVVGKVAVADTLCVGKEDGQTNLVDLLAEDLTGQKEMGFVLESDVADWEFRPVALCQRFPI